jgi:hypothetical protein
MCPPFFLMRGYPGSAKLVLGRHPKKNRAVPLVQRLANTLAFERRSRCVRLFARRHTSLRPPVQAKWSTS